MLYVLCVVHLNLHASGSSIDSNYNNEIHAYSNKM